MLNTSHATAIVVGTIIGSGIFLVPAGNDARDWLLEPGVSGVDCRRAALALRRDDLCGAQHAAQPYAGGEYVYIRGVYGDLPAFLYMWTWFAVAKPASIASVTTGLARTLAIFPALHWLDAAAIHVPFAVAWSQVFAIAATWLMTGFNYLGIRKAGDFQLVFTWLKGVLIVAIAGICFASRSRTLGKLRRLRSWARMAASAAS